MSYGGVRDGLHAWNYVQMENGEWYAVDVTWNDREKTSDDEYFLVGSDTYVGGGCTFAQNHIAESAKGASLPKLSATHYVPNAASTEEPVAPGNPTGNETPEPTVTPSETITALSTDIAFVADGKNVAIDAYNINNYNYFKLRDFAALVNGTGKTFSVAWDGVRQIITLTSGEAYEPLDTDLQPGDGKHKTALKSTASLVINGKIVTLEAYNINGFNYFKLRDLCEALDVCVTWDNATRTTGIDTLRGYGDENKAENVFHNENIYEIEQNNITVRPYYVYWENGKLYAECFVLNGFMTTVFNLDMKNLQFETPDGTVIAVGAFGKLENLSIAPQSYAKWRFVFEPDAVVTPDAPLSTLICNSTVNYSY